MNNILKIEHLSKVYAHKTVQVEVFSDINLTIKNPKIIAIMGESGAGKTTLLNIIGLLDSATQGTITYKDIFISDIKDKARFRNQNIGFVFQNHFLLEQFSAIENVALPLFLKTNNLRLAKEKAKHLLIEMGMEHRFHHKPGELSGGEKQRVAIARALSTEPMLILADEPTGNLDYKNKSIINKLFLNINKKYKKTVIMATHSKTLANQCQEIYFLEKGILKKNQKS